MVGWLLASAAALCISSTHAQPSPEVQVRISAAIAAAQVSNSTDIDYTAFVNPFIGTGRSFFSAASRVLTAISQITPIMGMFGKFPSLTRRESSNDACSAAQARQCPSEWYVSIRASP
jgi:hypothetical protein